MIKEIIQLFNLIPQTFWETFIEDLLVGLIILFIGSWLVPKYLDWRKRPHLEIVNQNNGSGIFLLTKAVDGFWEATLNFSVKNRGPFTQREWFWHIIIPKELQPQFISIDPTITQQENAISTESREWRHYYGSSREREIIFTGRGLRFNYEIKVKTTNKEAKEYKIHYYFSTEYGTWPRKAKNIESVIDKPDIVFSSKYLASVILKPRT